MKWKAAEENGLGELQDERDCLFAWIACPLHTGVPWTKRSGVVWVGTQEKNTYKKEGP